MMHNILYFKAVCSTICARKLEIGNLMAGLTTGQAAGVAAFMGFLAGMLAILCVIGVVYYVLLVISW